VGITKNEISRQTQFLDQRQRADILASLEEAGQIFAQPRASATKSAIVYRFCAGATA
jgi:hypothetical protein